MTSRREVIFGGLLTLTIGNAATCVCEARGKQAPNTTGCILADVDVERIYPAGAETRLYVSGQEPIISSSGDRDFDRALAQTLAKCADLLGVLPGFAFYDDRDGFNAYATSRIRMNRADGTVLMGQGLLNRLMRQPEAPDACVAAVCAHEFGHILQYKRGLHTQLKIGQQTSKRIELQADFFAGYFAGVRKRERPNFPAAVFAMTQYTFGDNMIDDPRHHGSPQERGAAVVHGFEAAYRDKLTLSDAIDRGTKYALTL
jgi:hypothetical protein